MNDLSIPIVPKLSYNDTHNIVICNHFNLNLFKELNNIIKTKITDESLLDFMKKQKIPPIRDKKTNKIIVDTNRRNCKRYTFNSNIVKDFNPILESYFKFFFRNDNMVIDIKVDPTHGDILYYENGDFFGKHKDTIPKCPYYPYHGIYPRLGDEDDEENNKFLKEWYPNEEWEMYSLIICLDSTQDNDNGNTIVWLKDHKLNCFNNNDICGFISMPHSFRLKKMDWLLFPASSLHEVTAIDQGKMNIKLKFDIWLRIKSVEYDVFSDIDTIVEDINKKVSNKQVYRCKCEYCKQPLTYRRKLILRALYNINNDIKKIILDYLDFFSLKDRCLYKMFGIKNNYINGIIGIMCSCHDCIEFMRINKILIYEDYSSDEYSSMCNDY